MKKTFLIFLISFLFTWSTFSQFARKDMVIPDITGYHTLKCDFHIHTVFSDGDVWPTVRVDEAWLMGYDAISITDHLEYQPHKEYIPVQHDASYEIAKPRGDRQDLIVIKGSEITRVMPPGHLNAIFIKDASRIETDRIRHMHAATTPLPGYLDSIDHQHQDYLLAIEETVNQGGFIFWNHPGWESQAKEGIKIYDIHLDLMKRGWLKGIEVANGNEWYPEAFQWGLDYGLAMLSNSDIHPTEGLFERRIKDGKRPVTLVFAREKSEGSIHEALDQARTAVWFKDMVIGKQEFLAPLVVECLEISKSFYIDNQKNRFYNLKNKSDFKFVLQPDDGEMIELMPLTTAIITMGEDTKEMGYTVQNFLVEPKKSLHITLSFD